MKISFDLKLSQAYITKKISNIKINNKIYVNN